MIRKGFYGLWFVQLTTIVQAQDNGLSKTANEIFMGNTPQMIINYLVVNAGLKLNMEEHKLPARITFFNI